MHPSSVYHLVGAKDIPVLRIGGSWRFNQDAIEKWMLDKISDNARVDDGLFSRQVAGADFVAQLILEQQRFRAVAELHT